MCIYDEVIFPQEKSVYQFGDKFYSTPTNGVPREILKQIFIDKLESSPHKKFILTGEYQTGDVKSTFRCTECNDEFRCTPREVLLRGRNCNCEWSKRVDEVNQLLKKRFPNLIFKSEYTHILQPIVVECKVCGFDGSAIANSLLSMKGDFRCHCYHNNIAGSVLNKIAEKYPKFKIQEKYINSYIPTAFKCEGCGDEFSVSTNSLLNSGRNCSCPDNSFKHERTQIFIDNLKEVNPNITLTSEFVSTKHKAHFECDDCGDKFHVNCHSMVTYRRKCSCDSRRSDEYYRKKLAEAFPNIELLEPFQGKNKSTLSYRCTICDDHYEAHCQGILRNGHLCNCDAAGKLRSFGGRPTWYNGVRYRSAFEARCAKKIFQLFKEDEVDLQKNYPNSLMRTDFYIKEYDCWIEVSTFRDFEKYYNRIEEKKKMVENFFFINSDKEMSQFLQIFREEINSLGNSN